MEKAKCEYVLTELGKWKVENFIQNCAAKRKEILDVGIDTAIETALPTEEDIVSDINIQGIDEDGDYYNSWGVTAHYNADTTLGLHINDDFICQF